MFILYHVFCIIYTKTYQVHVLFKIVIKPPRFFCVVYYGRFFCSPYQGVAHVPTFSQRPILGVLDASTSRRSASSVFYTQTSVWSTGVRVYSTPSSVSFFLIHLLYNDILKLYIKTYKILKCYEILRKLQKSVAFY